MKKYILFLIIFLALLAPIRALGDVMPYYINSLRRYGIGFSAVKSPVVMRKTPSSSGEIIETLNFDFKKNEASCLVNTKKCQMDEIFAAFSPSNNVALLTTMDETEGWNMVCFNNNENPVCGWIDGKQNKYYTWNEFLDSYGKKYGLYIFKDVQKADKILYSAPVKQTNATGSIELPKSISPWLVNGNWVLVKVLDFDNKMKTGWLNYRDNKGRLKVFPKF